nr:SIR2 family protein [Conexibacter arvalis]
MLGAGMSVEAGLPLGKELAAWIRCHELARGLDFSLLGAASEDPTAVLDVVDDHRAESVPAILDDLRAWLASLCRQAEVPEPLRHLAHVPGRLVLTLNYDDLLERAAEEEGRPVRSVTREQLPRLIGAGAPLAEDPLHVVHLHGSVRSPERFVLDGISYAKVSADEDLAVLFGGLAFQRRSVCILGTPLAELHLASLFRRYRGPQRHVIVCEEQEAEQIRNNSAPSLLRQIDGIVPCSFPVGRFGVLAPFCAELVEQGRQAESETAQATRPVAPPVDRLYVARKLLPLGDSEDPRIDLALGRISVVDEDEVAAASRALIIDSPGAGKTELLRRYAARSGTDEDTVYVRLRGVRALTGSTEALLTEWLNAADREFGLVEPSAVVSGAAAVHLLLDALDEQPPSVRRAAALAIDRVARAFPNVRITVTSRPTSALDAFGGEWLRFKLVFDDEWAQTFFSRAGRDRAAFDAVMASARSTVAPLLSSPFFLRRLADMPEPELKVAVARNNALDLVLSLLDKTIVEDPNLANVSTAVAAWMTDVALLMQLGGRRTMPRQALERITRRFDLGEVSVLTDQLVGRALLEESSDEWSFGHRLFADALVAQSLVDRMPSDWLDIIAPVVHSRSAVREDWDAAIAFLCSASADWRAAIAPRDPAVSARTTPVEADQSERRAAVQTLWSRAHERQIWLNERDNAPDDAEIVAKLVGAGGLDDERGAIHAAFHSSSRYDRLNALDVLVRIAPSERIELISHVLRDETDSTLRRNGAAWAERFGLTELADLVIARASAPADESEEADMTSIGLRLTAKADRLAVGRELLARGNTHIRDYLIFEDLPAIEHVRWIRDIRTMREDHTIYGDREKLLELLESLRDLSEDDVLLVAEALALTHASAPEAVTWIGSHRSVAARALVEVLVGGHRWISIRELLVAAGSEALEQAGCSEEALSWVRRQEASLPTRGRRVTPPNWGEPVADAPTLADVLEMDDPERMEVLVDQSQRLTRELSKTSPAVRRQLDAAIEELWGRHDIRDAVVVNDSGASISFWASVVLTYGHALELQLTAERWVQVASCGWLLRTQIGWLATQADQGRFDTAVDGATTARTFADLFAIAAEADVDADHLVARASDVASLDGIEGTRLLQALADARRPEALRTLQARFPDRVDEVTPLLAAAGDIAAQRAALRALIARFERGEQVDSHDALWLEAVRDPSLVDVLTETVIAGHQRVARNHPFDAEATALAALERIGGGEALDSLDQIVETRPWPGAQWLYHNRDRVLQRELTAAAAAPATDRLHRLDLATATTDR